MIPVCHFLIIASAIRPSKTNRFPKCVFDAIWQHFLENGSKGLILLKSNKKRLLVITRRWTKNIIRYPQFAEIWTDRCVETPLYLGISKSVDRLKIGYSLSDLEHHGVGNQLQSGTLISLPLNTTAAMTGLLYCSGDTAVGISLATSQ